MPEEREQDWVLSRRDMYALMTVGSSQGFCGFAGEKQLRGKQCWQSQRPEGALWVKMSQGYPRVKKTANVNVL